MAKQKQPCWIEDQIRRFGEDFILRMNPENIQRSAKSRIFKDMVKGNIDYGVYGMYFIESKFLENLIIAASNELQNNDVVLRALIEFDNNHPGDSLVIQNRTYYHGRCCIFKTILDRLYAVKSSYNVGYLSDISYVLHGYRNFI